MTAWHSGPTQTAPSRSVAAGPLAVAAAVEGRRFLGGAGSDGLGAANPSASGGRCDVARAEAACAGTDWSVAAATGVWVMAVGIAPD